MKPLGASAEADVTEYALVSPGSPTTGYDDKCLAQAIFLFHQNRHRSADGVTQARVLSKVDIYNNLEIQFIII